MASFLDHADTRQLQKTIDWHLDNIRDDAELAQRLEGIATNPRFNALTWYWAPRLYQRNRARFRAFVLQHFADNYFDAEMRGFGFEQIKWEREPGKRLDAWLAEVDRVDDAALHRRLIQWRWRPDKGWGLDEARWSAELRQRFATARSPAERAKVLEKFDVHAALEEKSALELYRSDAALAKPFLIKHLPHRPWRDNADKRWHELAALARQRGDSVFEFDLYRRLVPLDAWRSDALALARSTRPASEILPALEQRHPQGLGSDLGPAFIELLEVRGAELLPYVQRHLSDARAGWLGRDSALALARLARKRGWTDFWIAVLVKIARGKEYNQGIAETLDDQSIDERERLRRLALFSGVSREWNFAGWGLASVQQLEPKVALQLYERLPHLLRTQYKAHVTPAWGDTHAELFERAWAAGDEDLADTLAARYVTRGMWGRPEAKETAIAERTADLLTALKLAPGEFARRAASILTRVPAYAIRDYNNLLRNNRLARLLFERSVQDFLGGGDNDKDDNDNNNDDRDRAVRDLVEASEIHVQRLAYRLLATHDARAERLARDNLDILLGTLLRPLHRETRLRAFGALHNAARDPACARKVLARAREALALPDAGYPKEALVGLIGQVLALHPALAGAGEGRVVQRRAKVAKAMSA